MDTTTTYLGLELRSPILHGASPLAGSLDDVRLMEDSGVGAIVVYSLFEEQINHEKQELDYFLTRGTDTFAEALSYFPEPGEFANLHAEDYLEHIRKLKAAVDVPIIASLNGVSRGGWMDYAKSMEEAGADAIELNTYYMAADPSLNASDVEELYVDNLRAVKERVAIPVAMKLGPFFSAFANFAVRLDQAGADGLVLFNRFFGPVLDVENREVVPVLDLSSRVEMRLALRWIAILSGKLQADLAATGGVHTGEDALQMIMAGARAVMVVSALLKNGPEHVGEILDAMVRRMDECGYESVGKLRGCANSDSVAEPAAFERANYMKSLQSYE